MAETLHFPDISHYQTGLNLAGAPAVIAKATEGTTYRDPAYAGFKAQAAKLGIPFAGYHWLNTADLAAQAANAYAVAGSTPLMWDCEADGATVPRILDVTAQYRKFGGVASLCYLPRWWWQRIGSPDLRPLAAAGLAVVSSNYPAGGYTDTGPGWTAYGGVSPTIWQYTSTRLFNGQRVDFNAYRGTADQLRRALKPATPATTGDDDMDFNQSAKLDGVFNLSDTVKLDTDAVPDGKGSLGTFAVPLTAAFKRLEAKVDGLAEPAITVSLTPPDRTAIVAELLAALTPEIRDAVADLGEGGAKQVRADA